MRPGHPFGGSDDKRLTTLAARQQSVIALTQLRVLGYSERMVAVRVGKGWLHRRHRGVYAVGQPKLSIRGEWMAAVMACGTGSALSHHAAAALHDLRRVPTGDIDVTSARRRVVEGVRSHVSRHYATTRVDAIPVTTIEQTALDLAEVLRPQRLRSLLEEIQRRGLFDLNRFDALIARSPGRRGIRPLRDALAQLADDAPWTQSELEVAFLELVREHCLPEPQANVVVAGQLVDFYWPRQRVVVELDGWRFHRTWRSFEDDRRRDTVLQVAGDRAIRVTQRRLASGRRELLADLTRLLSAGP